MGVGQQSTESGDDDAQGRFHHSDRAFLRPCDEQAEPGSVDANDLVGTGREEGAAMLGQDLQRCGQLVGDLLGAPTGDQFRLVDPDSCGPQPSAPTVRLGGGMVDHDPDGLNWDGPRQAVAATFPLPTQALGGGG